MTGQAVMELGAYVADECRLHAASVGSLARQDVLDDLVAGASSGGGRVLLPAGANAGLDRLPALRRAGLRSVTYRPTKPPASWKGTPAEDAVDGRAA